ncbi:hypothetical protein PRIPAC_75930 [Pristionchus pacificus]|uniref:Sulfhydryl oxidase n=1 Tax=Pristionchus pacificus TaxID=54126 RepID=A0A2A6CZJ1_PRIPA|nr:hypothetical protein PRIPAC_75930 [Pristionchus pacificus]|eukprot:PDM83642.1 Thioredoxin [Pristionchus pacificus]
MLLVLAALPALLLAEVADFGTVPKGMNPTLYSSDDRVIQLDESTFNETIFCTRPDCPSFIVEFYSDWCGHCRSFAPLYKQLGKDVHSWNPVVRVAAMNCADSVNSATCRANGVQYFPYIKYFPRNATEPTSGNLLRAFRTLSEMRDQLTKHVMDDYSVNRFDDWPNFDFLKDMTTFSELWEEMGLNSSAEFVALVFENHPSSLTGAQLLMDLLPYTDRLYARRALKNHPLVEALHLTDFPSLVIFKKGQRVPVVQAELRRLLLNEMEQFLHAEKEQSEVEVQFTARKNASEECINEPEKCKLRYYVSESDMLKAMRYAILRETARTGAPLSGSNLTALHGFLSMLHDHFPVMTVNGDDEQPLPRSSAAISVFARLRDWLEERGANVNDSEYAVVDVDDFQKEFLAAEEDAGNPFPITAEWEHCKGSTRQLRGYSCGLWTTFHTLSVSAYKQGNNASNASPLPLLSSIRAWVEHFFGCIHCRDHFVKMTTRTFPIEIEAKRFDDVYLYLWKAHNIVNARLKGRDTEDPQFLKYQFPARFLCNNCSASEEQTIKPFLLSYYSDIKPYTAPVEKANGNK